MRPLSSACRTASGSLSRRLLATVLVLSAFALPLSAQSGGDGNTDPLTGPGFEIERLQRFEALGELRRVTVDNAFGDIRARFGGYGDKVELRAIVQHFEDEGPQLEIRTARSEQGLELTVGYAESGRFTDTPRPLWRKRADLVLFVPDGITFASRATDGLTELKGMRSDIEARSLSGDIIARKIDGDLDLESKTGDVLAVLKPGLAEKSKRQLMRTGGELTIYLSDEANISFEGRSRGFVSTDFSLTMSKDRDEKEVAFELGKGTLPIVAEAGEHLRMVRKPSADRARARRGDRAPKKDHGKASELPKNGDGDQDREVVATAGEAQEVSTLTGDITLRVPEGSFSIELATSGEITVDFPVEIEYRYHGEPSKEGLITIGSGATSIRLESRRGTIRVLRAH